MSTLQYRGRRPDNSNYALLNKSHVDALYEESRVDEAYVAGAVQDVLPSLASLTYVTNQDALRATRTAVQAADNNYVPTTELAGVSSGVVPLNNSGSIAAAHTPSTIHTHRPPTIKYADTINLVGTQNLTAPAGPKQFLAATLTITDPGYSYIPLPFATVQGGAVNSTDPVTRSTTTSCYGQLTVLDTSDVQYGWTVCSGRKVLDFHILMPFADDKINPLVRPPVDGDLTLKLYLGLYGGTTYTFTNTGFEFYCLIFPGVA